MKKGIALFSTLMILVLVIMLMSVALKNSTNIKIATLQDRYLIQENITVADVIKLIDEKIVLKFKGLKNEQRVEVQKKLFSSPLTITDSVTNSTITVIMTPNDGKQNINFINSTEGEKYIKKIFDRLGVKESEILIDIILANITSSDKYSDDYKIHLKDKNKVAGYIRNKIEFDNMLDLYVQNTTDTEVFNISFEKYFNFYVNSEQQYNRLSDNVLDINYIEVVLLDSVVSLKNSIRANIKNKSMLFYKHSQLELESEQNQKAKLDNHGFGFKTKNIFMEINTKSMNNKVEYLLNYNLETKKISNISMDRWIY